MTSSLNPFFEPKGVAIIGASASPEKLSYGIVKNMMDYGYEGKIYPINPRAKEILGLKCYPGIADVPDPVELAVIVLPSQMIPTVIDDCGKRGIRAITVISGGFKEVGGNGKDLELEIIQASKRHNIRMIGPNCVGTMNLITGLNTTFIKGVPARGGIGFISQSGAVCGGIVNHIEGKGIGFSHLISLGNEADVDETDMIEYLGQDSHTNVIAAYVEGIQDGQKFIRVSRQVTPAKPLVILKAGRSDEGARAVSSHTGSLAGSQTAYTAAFRQCGAIEVFSVTDLLNVSMALDWLKSPKGRKVAIVTNSGGPAALASDSLAQYGLSLAHLSEKSQVDLRSNLNPAAQVQNPVDMLGGADEQAFVHAMQIVLEDPQVDMTLAILVPTSLVNTEAVAQSIVDAAQKTSKPVIACFMGSAGVFESRRILHKNHIPMVDFPELTGVMFGALCSRMNFRDKLNDASLDNNRQRYQSVEQIFKIHNQKKVWGEHDTRPLLDAYGIELVPGELITDRAKIINAAEQLGYPVVLKLASEDVLHKSDSGAIKIGIQNREELNQAINEVVGNVKRAQPNALIEGFLVEKMIDRGAEIIIGMKRDLSFGPLMMFGMGGVFVEVFKDVSFRIAPLTKYEAHKMIKDTKAFTLLKGYRGGIKYDLDAIVENLIKISHLATDFPRIKEIEINPLRVFPEGQGAMALDCRMITD